MSQNFQIMKVNIVDINPKEVAAFFSSQKCSVLPLWRHLELPLVETQTILNKKSYVLVLIELTLSYGF